MGKIPKFIDRYKEKKLPPNLQTQHTVFMENKDEKVAKTNATQGTERPISRNVRHILPGKKKGTRLRPIFDILVDENMSISELARRCGMAKQSMSTRFAVDDCRISEFEKMAEELGYEAKIVLTPKQEA